MNPVRKLDFKNKFQATAEVWGVNLKDIEKTKIILDNYFQKLKIDYIGLTGPGHISYLKYKEWWDKILPYCRKKGYIVAPGGMGPNGPFWGKMTPAMLKYIYSKYPDVIQIVRFASENWAGGRASYIKSDRIILPSDTDEKKCERDSVKGNRNRT